ncbi:hypothetical protein ACFOWM_07895 [Ferruginibacter yonginensis]|uniref:Uncharacterized protein n=1 Tax=Ferruginibacter yonginensis TaxID=1310416 RepID=A0ABV8QT04_9BACT
MKIFFTTIVILAFNNMVTAQAIKNYKVANQANIAERTLMLDLLRSSLKKDYQQDVVFSVNVFNVSNKYAWLKATAARKDGQPIKFKADDADFMDCCHVEALFIKKSTGWAIAESGSFSTDVWYDGIWKKYNAPVAIWGSDYHN